MKIILGGIIIFAVTITLLLTYIEHKIKEKHNREIRNNIKKLDDTNTTT
jgi:hypothetical protein